MDFRVIIPAHFDSKRLPGKALVDIGGKPMIQHVYERACESGAESVVIATNDERIRDAAATFDAPVCMTLPDHASGTERIAEAVVALDYEDDEIIVNLQGDDPLMPPAVIHQVAHDLTINEQVKVATICQSIKTAEELFNPDVVKVVSNKRGYAMYFSRAPIPWHRDRFPDDKSPSKKQHFRHVGLYAYRVRYLQEYVESDPCPLEETERLEQLRVLWTGHRIHVGIAKKYVPIDVNSPEDLEKVRELVAAQTTH